MNDSKAAVIVGVGPGLGSAIARRFARGGFAVVLMARGRDGLVAVQEELERSGARATSIEVDASDPASVSVGFARARDAFGAPEVLVYNASAFRMGGIMEVPVEDFERCWRATCLGGFLAAREVVPAMVERRRGTILFTGATASLRGSARFSALAVGKFGLRALAQSLARELGPSGVHVAHIVVDAVIDTPQGRARTAGGKTLLSPEALAETYWQLHVQDATAWTQEIDVRPAVEPF
jgi:NAD(P)-dependent dehydrogenase (short-subunit alcohol dehydrogenase family)